MTDISPLTLIATSAKRLAHMAESDMPAGVVAMEFALLETRVQMVCDEAMLSDARFRLKKLNTPTCGEGIRGEG